MLPEFCHLFTLIVIYLPCRDFMAKLSRLSDSLGMKIAAPCDVVFKPRMKATMPFLEEIVLKHKKLELIVVILPKKGADSGYGM